MAIEKVTVVQKFIELLEEHLDNLKNSLSETQRGAREAPGSNVTHSDTSKSRLSDVALGLEKRVIEVNGALVSLRYPVSHVSRVTIGALVGIRNLQGGGISYYYIVRQAGGHTITVDDISVTSISAGAPLCRNLMNKEEGDDIEYQGKELQIEFVE